MLLLLVRIAEQLYCLRTAEIAEVIPRVPLQPVPHAPASLAGLLHYRGEVIPVLDLRTLLTGEPSNGWLSTRIVIVATADRHIGLVAERLTETLEIDAARFVPAPVTVDEAPYLGRVLLHDGGVVRELLVERLTTGLEARA